MTFITRAVVFEHLIGYGFEKWYNTWVRHGEELINPNDLDYLSSDEDEIDDTDGLLNERFRKVVQ